MRAVMMTSMFVVIVIIMLVMMGMMIMRGVRMTFSGSS